MIDHLRVGGTRPGPRLLIAKFLGRRRYSSLELIQALFVGISKRRKEFGYSIATPFLIGWRILTVVIFCFGPGLHIHMLDAHVMIDPFCVFRIDLLFFNQSHQL